MPDLFNETLLGEFSFIINNEKETCFSAFKKKKNTAAALHKPFPFLRLGKGFAASA